MLLEDALPPLAVTSSRHQSARAKVGRRVVPRDSASGHKETCSRSVCFVENFLHQLESHHASLLDYSIMMISSPSNEMNLPSMNPTSTLSYTLESSLVPSLLALTSLSILQKSQKRHRSSSIDIVSWIAKPPTQKSKFMQRYQSFWADTLSTAGENSTAIRDDKATGNFSST